MTIASFNARLKKCDPHLRIRRRTGLVMQKAEGFAMIGFFRGNRYLGIASINGDVPYYTRRALFRIERIPGVKKPLPYLHSQMRRGRQSLINLISGHRGINHRWQRQLLKI